MPQGNTDPHPSLQPGIRLISPTYRNPPPPPSSSVFLTENSGKHGEDALLMRVWVGHSGPSCFRGTAVSTFSCFSLSLRCSLSFSPFVHLLFISPEFGPRPCWLFLLQRCIRSRFLNKPTLEEGSSPGGLLCLKKLCCDGTPRFSRGPGPGNTNGCNSGEPGN